MTINVKQTLQTLRASDFKHWVTTFWLVKRKLSQQQAKYSVLKVDTDAKLEKKLKQAVTDKVLDTDYQLDDYDFLTADQDKGLLTIASSDTDVMLIQAEIEKGTANAKVEQYEELLDSWAMVIKLEYQDKTIYAYRKINKFNNAARLSHISFIQFKDKELKDLDEKEIFTIDTQVDFFTYEGTTFIANKKEFESTLNFRAGMEKNRDVVLQEFVDLKILSDASLLKEHIGANLNYLRKVSSIQKSGYYKDAKFLEELIKVNDLKKWGLTVENGAIVINEDSIDLVLTLLNNGRLESPINHEIFDASVKKKVT
ncbi:MAG TPA: Kiwa anti-phage protein KwaB-like domain-containing protein [Methylophilus sp.]|uniref:Kiwa anti-phage protein KwaB-like domain-containing protein n=1 Tax=Methylophilus sp. TaxID=29541 RepID=UPI002B74415C|nr:Kiwa anti-phage protein KwaB-like domain-containing protein [Methylophilus sp.]HSH88327.1 Kiwa anti-phage protein KwaB-like domain-containing protein [Methylophilus sp.]